MVTAERLLRVVGAPGFQRLKRYQRRGSETWEIWVSPDGTIWQYEGSSLDEVLRQAERRLRLEGAL